MLKSYYEFLNENKSNVKISISDNFKKKLLDMNNKFSNILLNIKDISNLRNKYADYLDYDEKNGMITYLVNDIENPIEVSYPYNEKNRKPVKPTKILSKIFVEPEKEGKLEQIDIEKFSNEMKPKVDKIEIWKGVDILKAYNYTDLIDMTKFSSSCANFNQKKAKEAGKSSWTEPEKYWYDVYIENPDTISVIVVVNKDGNVLGRRMLFTGEQFSDNGDYKKGEKVGLAGNYYGIGGQNSVYDKIILEWIKKKGYETFDNKRSGKFQIQLKNYKYPHFPPFDGFYINLNNGVISYPGYGQGWSSCYKLKQNI